MTNCLNCSSEAVYQVNNTGVATQYFCDEDLPKFLRLRDGNLHYLVEKILEVKPVEAVVKPKASKKSEEPAPVVVVETVAEPAVEAPVENNKTNNNEAGSSSTL